MTEPREARKDEPIGNTDDYEMDGVPAVPRSDEPREDDPTIVRDPEHVACIAQAEALARGWRGAAERESELRLAASPTTSAPAGDGLRKAAEETVKVINIMLERQTLTGAATARDWLRSALSARDDGLDVERLARAYGAVWHSEGRPLGWPPLLAERLAAEYRRLSPSEPTAPTQD